MKEIEYEKEKWETYFEETKTNSPSEIAINAMKALGDNKGLMIDLGCGAGTDSLYFLKNGWNVLSIDDSPEFFVNCKSKMPKDLQNRLTIEKMKFEELALPKAECMIANFSLPFCNPNQFNDMWSEIVKQIKVGGIFSAILFGNRDEWASEFSKERTFHTKEEVSDLFDEFEIINLKELEYEGKCCGRDGRPLPKHWHYYQVVARKKNLAVSLLPYTKERVQE